MLITNRIMKAEKLLKIKILEGTKDLKLENKDL